MEIPVCSTSFMEKSLRFFNKELVSRWLKECKKIDDVIKESIEANLEKFVANQNCITKELETEFVEKLASTGAAHNYHFPNLEAYYGYTVYAFPDKGEINSKSGNPDLYYGIAKTNSFGIAHTHKLSDAFNYILEGEGVFTGDPKDEGRFNFYYHGKPMLKDAEFEIPIGMTHGHLVREGNDIWFLFVQECGFKPKLRCAGDFHTVQDYDRKQFGPYYI